MTKIDKLTGALLNFGQIAEGLKNIVFGDDTADFVKTRRAICNSCDDLDTTGQNCAIQLSGIPCCKLCGCVVKVKTTVPGAECPIGKWGREDDTDKKL